MNKNKIDKKTSLEIFDTLHNSYESKLDYLTTQEKLLYRQNKLIDNKENNINKNTNSIKDKKDLLHTIRRKLEYTQKDNEVFVIFTGIFKTILLILSLIILSILGVKLKSGS